ncbi:MAG TPA: hypothetical protein VHO90_22520 [Bacteroidales bacterium]|nr:hypothetical protein [Bacteroidales bacterium]
MLELILAIHYALNGNSEPIKQLFFSQPPNKSQSSNTDNLKKNIDNECKNSQVLPNSQTFDKTMKRTIIEIRKEIVEDFDGSIKISEKEIRRSDTISENC